MGCLVCKLDQLLFYIEHAHNKGRPDTCVSPGPSNNLAPLQTYSLETLRPRTGLTNFLRARAQTVDNCGKLSLQAPYFRLLQCRLSAPYIQCRGELLGWPAPRFCSQMTIYTYNLSSCSAKLYKPRQVTLLSVRNF